MLSAFLRIISIQAAIYLNYSQCMAQNDAGFYLFHSLEQDSQVGFAPDALLDAFGLMYYGSAGETEKAFQSTLFNSITRADISDIARRKKRSLNGYRSIGSLWFSEHIHIENDFRDNATSKWEFHLAREPLRSNPQSAVNSINLWYKNQTNNYFEQVIRQSDISEETDMLGIIVTAFISPWKKAYFRTSSTSAENFYASKTKKHSVQMMKSDCDFYYHETESFQALIIEYSSAPFRLLLLLPKQANNFTDAVATIDQKLFKQVLEEAKLTRMKLWLPKVKYTARMPWHRHFKDSDLSYAFTPGKADFKHINANKPEPLYISRLIQNISIKWDEQGTEARSFTSFSADPFASDIPPPPNPIPFIANHPFVYIIYNNETFDLAFMGTISSPRQMLAGRN